MPNVYIDPLTDYGSKLLFGQKAVMIAMLNALLPEEDAIADLEYARTEVVGSAPMAKAIVYDFHCVTLDARRIIVEVQQASHHWFMDRCLHYVSRAMDDQIAKGEASFELKPVYLVAIMDFDLGLSGDDFRSVVELRDQNGALFTNKLRLYFLDLTKLDFMTDAAELAPLEQWMRAIKTMGSATEVPSWVTDTRVRDAYGAAELSKLPEEERVKYALELKADENRRAEWLAKFKEGKSEGKAEGKAEVAVRMYRAGYTLETVAELVGVSVEQVELWISQAG